MRVRVEHSIGALAADLVKIPPNMVRQGSAIVRKDVRAGRTLARKIARQQAGPHGANFYKRITDEMTGPLEGEYGPTAVKGERYVGVEGDAGPTRDLEKSLRVIGPKFGRDVSGMVDDLFWPGGDQ